LRRGDVAASNGELESIHRVRRYGFRRAASWCMSLVHERSRNGRAITPFRLIALTRCAITDEADRTAGVLVRQ